MILKNQSEKSWIKKLIDFIKSKNEKIIMCGKRINSNDKKNGIVHKN